MRIYYYPACGTCKKALKWLDENKIGYEIPFTRHFYKYVAPRPSDEIMAEIKALESELDGALIEVFK